MSVISGSRRFTAVLAALVLLLAAPLGAPAYADPGAWQSASSWTRRKSWS
ncbi:hypothetical protein [Pseudarthrobacter cellobiosi]|nr:MULTISPECIES: hypothetical protein [unclassified Pseudarthrobacter]MCO4255254.1 hypothetical protein [Pseudarthrobacter sp. HLT1-5]MCO4275324.1 hypothetical protein [Pseudarthrobacter sp. HLT3-5]